MIYRIDLIYMIYRQLQHPSLVSVSTLIPNSNRFTKAFVTCLLCIFLPYFLFLISYSLFLIPYSLFTTLLLPHRTQMHHRFCSLCHILRPDPFQFAVNILHAGKNIGTWQSHIT